MIKNEFIFVIKISNILLMQEMETHLYNRAIKIEIVKNEISNFWEWSC